MSGPDVEKRRPQQDGASDDLTQQAAASSLPRNTDDREITDPPGGTDQALIRSDGGEREAFLEVVNGLPEDWEFTAEQLADNDHYGLPIDHHNRIGSWTRYACTLGLIERVGYRQARRPTRHGAVVALWRRTGVQLDAGTPSDAR